MYMRKIVIKLLFLFLLVSFVSCDTNPNKQQAPKEHKVKTIDFEEFKIDDINDKAKNDLRDWKNFQSLMQVIVSMAPTKIKNTDDLVLSNPDSLLLYSRLYPKNSKTEKINTAVEQDWRTPANGSRDTVFRIEKTKNEQYSFVQWQRFLIANIPYTFSLISKKVNYPQIDLYFEDESSQVLKTTLSLDTLSPLASNVKRNNLSDEWYKFEVTFSPKKTSNYLIKLSFDEDAKVNDNVILYRSVLEIPAKYFNQVSKYSDKIVGAHSEVQSSYYSVFFWLMQIEDAMKELLTNDSFPEPINTSTVKARFRLFQTQIKVLADNIKNNPDFKEEELKSNIKLIEHTFNSIIARINNIYNNDLDEKMKGIE